MEEIRPLLEKDFTQLQQEKLFEDMASIDGITDYLRYVISNDMMLYFNAQKEQQDLVKGAYTRTKHFYDQILKARKRLDAMKK